MSGDVLTLGAGGPSGFAPADLAGLKLKVDFSDFGSMTISDSPDIDAIRDKSTSNLLFVQGTASRKPEVSALGVYSAAIFDGVDDFVQVSSQPLTGNIGRAFGVFRFSTLPTTSGNIVGAGDNDGTTAFDCLRIERVAGNNYFAVAGGSLLGNRVRGSTVIAINTTYIVSVESNGSAWTIRVNGVAETLVVVAGSNNGSWYNDFPLMDTITIGWLDINTSAVFFKGLIGEILIYDAVTLSAGEIGQVEAFLATKWGVTL